MKIIRSVVLNEIETKITIKPTSMLLYGVFNIKRQSKYQSKTFYTQRNEMSFDVS